MRKVVKKLEMGVDVPLVIDTTELDVLEAALKTAPGRCLINSTHLESGRDKADKIFKLAKEHNAAVIVLTIDENGHTPKNWSPRHLRHRRQRPRTKPQDLVYDALTFTLETGDEEFQLPSNHRKDTFFQTKPAWCHGFSWREQFFFFSTTPPVANWLCSIIASKLAWTSGHRQSRARTATRICRRRKNIAEDLIFNRRADALQRYIEYYEKVTPTEQAGTSKSD